MDPIWRVITLMCVTWVWCSDICRGAIKDRHESINMQRFFKVKVVNGACIEWTFSIYILILGIEQQHTPEPRLLTYHRSDIRATFGKQWSQSKTNNAINIDILLIYQQESATLSSCQNTFISGLIAILFSFPGLLSEPKTINTGSPPRPTPSPIASDIWGKPWKEVVWSNPEANFYVDIKKCFGFQ